MLKDAREEGFSEGYAEGLEEGKKILEPYAQLVPLLTKQNRKNDILKAANNKNYEEKLFKEFNL